MKSPRPKAVKVALGCIIASFVISEVEMLRFMDLSDPGNVVQFILISLTACAIVFGIYVGKNWVRWLFAASTAIWLVSLAAHRLSEPGHFHGFRLFALALNLTVSIVAVIFLFYPESNDWFRKKPTPGLSRCQSK